MYVGISIAKQLAIHFIGMKGLGRSFSNQRHFLHKTDFDVTIQPIQFIDALPSEEKGITLEMLMIADHHISCIQFFDKIGLVPFLIISMRSQMMHMLNLLKFLFLITLFLIDMGGSFCAWYKEMTNQRLQSDFMCSNDTAPSNKNTMVILW